MNDIEDIATRVRETVRKDNPELPLEHIDMHDTWYMAEHVWPYLREMKDERQATT